MKAILPAACILAVIAVASSASAQEEMNAQGFRRPGGNLQVAQTLVDQAYDRVSEAQRNRFIDLGGHAAKAKDLLRRASVEIALAQRSPIR